MCVLFPLFPISVDLIIVDLSFPLNSNSSLSIRIIAQSRREKKEVRGTGGVVVWQVLSLEKIRKKGERQKGHPKKKENPP